MVLGMLPGFTLTLMLFIFFIFTPGSAALFISGRTSSQYSLRETFTIGSLIFVAAFLFISFWQENAIKQFIDIMMAAAGISGGKINVSVISRMLFIEYVLAVVLGLWELIINVGILPCKNKGVKTNRDNLLQKTFIMYRKSGIRPYVKVMLKDGQNISGECLRYSWDDKGSLLLKDADNPEKQIWVPLNDDVKIEFVNSPSVIDVIENEQKVFAYRRVLNWMAEGYGDEIYGKKEKSISEPPVE